MLSPGICIFFCRIYNTFVFLIGCAFCAIPVFIAKENLKIHSREVYKVFLVLVFDIFWIAGVCSKIITSNLTLHIVTLYGPCIIYVLVHNEELQKVLQICKCTRRGTRIVYCIWIAPRRKYLLREHSPEKKNVYFKSSITLFQSYEYMSLLF